MPITVKSQTRRQRPTKAIVVLFFTGLSLASFIAALQFDVWGLETSLKQGLAWIFSQQRAFHRELITTLRQLSSSTGGNTGTDAALWLISASFLYGIFHAAGPGHGKAVISTFLLTNNVSMRRGLFIAAGGALCQGLSAIIIVYGLIWALGWHTADTMDIINWTARFSFVLLAIMGLYWIYWASRLLLQRSHRSAADSDHNHFMDAERINRANSPQAALAMMFAIGLRPCSGAILVLVFAYTIQIPWAGIVAALTMAVGTAMTVSALATIAVKANALARSLTASSSKRSDTTRRRMGGAVALICGLFLVFLGASLLLQTFGSGLSAGVL